MNGMLIHGRRFLFLGVAACIAAAPLWSEAAPLDEATVRSLETMPKADEFIASWVASETAAQGRAGAADSISRVVVDHPDLVERSLELRQMGHLVEPEFSDSVLSRIETADTSFTRGNLLQLLRGTASGNVPRIAQWLNDERPGEDLQERSRTAPKLREAIASGAIPLRVCDVAYNVIVEISSPPGDVSQLLTRSEDLAVRDQRVRQLEEDLLPGKAAGRRKPLPQPQAGDATSGPASANAGSAPGKGTGGAAVSPRASGFQPWMVLAAAGLAVAAFLGFQLKRRK